IDENLRPRLFHPHLHQTVWSSIRCARPRESNFIEWDRTGISVPLQIVHELFGPLFPLARILERLIGLHSSSSKIADRLLDDRGLVEQITHDSGARGEVVLCGRSNLKDTGR